MSRTRPPSGLGKAGARLWRATVAEYELEQHERELLANACRTLDRIADLDGIVMRDGPMVTTAKGDVRPHPAMQQARLERHAFARLLSALGLPDPDNGRARTGASMRAQRAAVRRWDNVRALHRGDGGAA